MQREAKEAALTAARVRELLSYDPDTGVLTWRVGAGTRALPGACVAKNIGGRGYLRVSIDGKRYPQHRVAWLIVHGKWPDAQLDHIDGDKTNNRISNLREATNSQNNCNKGVGRSNASGVKGVWWSEHRGRWVVQVKANGKYVYAETYRSLENAKTAYATYSKKYHGEFGRRA